MNILIISSHLIGRYICVVENNVVVFFLAYKYRRIGVNIVVLFYLYIGRAASLIFK